MRPLASYSFVRGFNYQPSVASHGIDIWGPKFDPRVVERELGLGKKHFPKFNTVRIWLSHDAFIADPQSLIRHFGQVMDICGRLGLAVVPVLFNGWHTYPDFGGISVEQIGHFSGERFTLFEEYLAAVVGLYAGDQRILLWDLCNEPFNNAREGGPMDAVAGWLERIYRVCKELDADIPMCVGNAPNPEQIRRSESVSDVITFHPYFAWNAWVPTSAEFVAVVDWTVDLARQAGKALLVTETGWGALDDRKRAETLTVELNELARREIGFIVHLLHHTPVADGHRLGCGPITQAGYMAFVEADGSLRPHHEVFNAF